MGSALSAVYAALCSFVNAQLDKAEERRLMASFPHLRDLPADERERKLRWLMNDDGDGHPDSPEADYDKLQGRDLTTHPGYVRCRYQHPRFKTDKKNTSK